jgi:hypothetical protein
MPTGRYTVNQIRLSDLGLNASYTYFRTSPFNSGNSDGLVDQLDEPAPSIEIKTPNPDLVGPELDVNRITVKAQPTNTVTPDGETLVTIDYYVRDNASGYGGGSHLKLRDPQGGEHFFWIGHRNASTRFFDGDPKAWEKYTFETLLPRGSVPGTWGLLQMTLSDKANNLKSYSFLETVRFDPNSTAAADLNIIGDPVGQSYRTGETIRLSVQTAGSAKVSYEWFKDGVSLATNTTQSSVSGARTAQLTVSGAKAADAGTYYCVVTNDAGRVVSKAVEALFAGDPTAPTVTSQPTALNLTAGESRTLSVTATGSATFTYQWRKDGVAIPGATAATLELSSVKLTDAGSYTVVVTNSLGSVTSAAATVAVQAASVAPTITSQLVGLNLQVGQSGTLSISASGTAPLAYQWRRDGVAIPGATGSTLTLAAVTQASAGKYTVVVSNPAGSVTSNEATVVVAEPLAARIGNVSIRTTLAARQVLIVGLTMSGGEKPVLMRAVGPGLGAFGVTGVMPDPTLGLYNGNLPIAANDNWGGGADLLTAAASVGAFPLGATSKDAVLLRSLSGGRTLQVQGAEAGNVLVEAYDAGSGHTPRLVNVSARNISGSGEDALIAGFSILGNTSKRILIRAVGPTLGSFGVLGAQVDPKLEVYSDSKRIADNDNWPASLASVFDMVGAFALSAGSRDAAVELTLAPGGYTVHVSPASGGAGEVLIEIYEVP